MNAPAALQKPRVGTFAPARIWYASPDWLSSIRGFFERDIRGYDLSAEDRISRLPAAAYCNLTWLLHGKSRLIVQGDAIVQQAVPLCAVTGCQTRHIAYQAQDDIRLFGVAFYPEVFQRSFGVDPASIQDRHVDAAAVLSPRGMGLVEAVAAAPDNEARQALIENYLRERLAEGAFPHWMRLRNYMAGVSLTVAARTLGFGMRQAQRLITGESGLRFGTLRKLWRGEHTFMQFMAQMYQSKWGSWSEFAVESGYVDQAHLIREWKSITGRTPMKFFEGIKHEEADWFYRASAKAYIEFFSKPATRRIA